MNYVLKKIEAHSGSPFPEKQSLRTSLPVICLGGPTGSGKTALALKLAAELDCEIINADSRQVYADFPIVTAQPDENETKRAPHHLYGFLASTNKLDAYAWAQMAHKKALEIHARGHLPLVVGGSGFYFHALLLNFSQIPAIPEAISKFFAEKLRLLGPHRLHGELTKVDPTYAAKIHPNDKQRIQRALEVYTATGRSFSSWHESPSEQPFCKGPLFTLDYPLTELLPGLKRRLEIMQTKGAKEEIINAWRKCPDGSAPGWSGIGCKETLAYLQGRLSWGEWQKEWFFNTRAYAKRQLTWFRGRKYAIPVRTRALQTILSHPASLLCRKLSLLQD